MSMNRFFHKKDRQTLLNVERKRGREGGDVDVKSVTVQAIYIELVTEHGKQRQAPSCWLPPHSLSLFHRHRHPTCAFFHSPRLANHLRHTNSSTSLSTQTTQARLFIAHKIKPGDPDSERFHLSYERRMSPERIWAPYHES